MIQRIQSLYLLLSAAATSLMFFLPMYYAKLEGWTLQVGLMDAQLTTDADGSLVDSSGHSYMGIMTIVTISLSILTIFLFKNRTIQMRLARFASLLHTGLLVVFLFFAVEGARTMDAAVALNGGEEIMGSYQLGAFLPIIGMVLCFLAGRAIMKDEALVRSASRLR